MRIIIKYELFRVKLALGEQCARVFGDIIREQGLASGLAHNSACGDKSPDMKEQGGHPRDC